MFRTSRGFLPDSRGGVDVEAIRIPCNASQLPIGPTDAYTDPDSGARRTRRAARSSRYGRGSHAVEQDPRTSQDAPQNPSWDRTILRRWRRPRPTLGWLPTEDEKVPYRTYSEGKQVQKRFFTMKFPVAVDAKAATFAYVDPGLTTEPHSRAAHEPSARRAGLRGFTAGFQAADLVTAGFNLRTRAALHIRARATESSSHRGRCFGRRRRSDTD